MSCSSSSPADPVAERWVERAACAGIDPELWFPNDRDPNERAQAIRICGTCDVRTECLKVARKRRERFGIWGGVDFTK